MEEKYIELLLKKCINIKNNKPLFINYDEINQNFIDKLVNYARINGVKEIYLDKNNIFKEHELLSKLNIDQIESNEYFNDSIWDIYAKKKANFLVFRTLIPGIMEDIEPQKISKAAYIRQTTKKIYNKEKSKCKFQWCFAALPNKLWAKKIFGDREDAEVLLENNIYNFCKIDTLDPINSWDKYLKESNERLTRLNNLKIKTLNYKNSIGTDLSIGLLENSIWCNVAENGICNMPSYEIYTTPDFRRTNGIVYSSKPLNYNGGIVDEFWIKFKNGKAIECGAKKGEKVLKSIVNSDTNSCYIGECALVENNSPISKTGKIFGITLIDENASCHLALGRGFPKCIKNGKDLTDEELKNIGINLSNIHVDFMIGTHDLEIIGETFDNKKVKIFENGCFKI